MPMPEPGYDIDAWRRRIPLLASCIPFNNCSQSPQTDLTRAAADRYLESWNRTGMDWDAWMEEVRLAKVAFARLIGAAPDEVAVFSSVSEATSAVASALDFTGRKRGVVASEMEFPTSGHVWLAQERRGAQVSWVAMDDGMIDGAAYDAAIRDDTALVAAGSAHYLNGFIQDIGRIVARAHDADALVFTDAYQALGAIPVNVRESGVDFLASGNLKYHPASNRDRMVRTCKSIRVRREAARLVDWRQPFRLWHTTSHERIHRSRGNGDAARHRDREDPRVAPGLVAAAVRGRP
jgi:selenocysteine lyase/cysteine desulfurase